MERPRDESDDFASSLRALSPRPGARFAAELDARAAAGFPRSAGGIASGIARFADRLRAVPPRRLVAPAGALALVAIVLATAVVSVRDSSSPTPAAPGVSTGEAPSGPAAGIAASPPPAAAREGGPEAGTEGAASQAGATEVSPAVPGPVPVPGVGGARRRDVERSATLVLATSPPRVRRDSQRVFAAVHDAEGIVLRSTIADGAAGEAGADFELLIPSAHLDEALTALSAIDTIRSRRESSLDITAPTAQTAALLRDSRSRIASLLEELASAGTGGERAAIESKLRAERDRSTTLKKRRTSLRRRAGFSRVSLRIETGRDAAAQGGGGGGWGVQDGVAAAGRVLSVAAGVAIVGLALLAPLAALGFAALLGRRAWLRTARARAL